MEGTSGFVERISTACPSFSCTIRKLLITAPLFTAEESAALRSGLTSGLTSDLTPESAGAWARTGKAPDKSIPAAKRAHKSARKPRRNHGGRQPQFGRKVST